ncbi:MAG: hypothetical protein V4596_03605 [Bdellovibrionota bacterium]
MKNLISIKHILSLFILIVSLKSNADLLSIQTKIDTDSKKTFFYFPNIDEALKASGIFPSPSCAKVPISTPTKEIEPVRFVTLERGGQPISLPLEEVLAPGFNIIPGYPQALQEGNKLESITQYFSLPDIIFKVDVTECIPKNITDNLYQYTTRGNCFNAAVRFHAPEEPMESMDQEVLVEFLKNCEEVTKPQFGDIGVFILMGKPEHAFVYIKDNWVFTKNGETSKAPYQFQRFHLTEKIYTPWITEKMRFYRCGKI